MSRAQRRVNLAIGTVRILRTVVERKTKLEVAWSAEKALWPHDGRVLRDMCSGTLRHLEHYSRFVDYYAEPHAADQFAFKLLACSFLYQQEHMENAPSFEAIRTTAAAVSSSVVQKSWAPKAMTSFLDTMSTLSAEERLRSQTEASRLSLPPWLYRELSHAPVPISAFAPLCLQRPDSLSLCVPAPREDYLSELYTHDASLSVGASEIVPLGVVIHSRPRDVDMAVPGLAEKRVHVQDLAQQYGPSRLRPVPPGERVLDATAAPGGKSRCLLRHQPHVAGHLIAVEQNRRKANALRESLPAATVICADAADPSQWWDGKPFAAILLDPPCTATGLLRALPEIKVHRSVDDVDILRAMQLRLLKGVWPMLKPGGELLYSTCSLLDAENCDVLRDFLDQYPDALAVKLRPPSASTTSRTFRALGRRNKHDVPPSVSIAASRPHGGITFYPSLTHQGGFAAILRKQPQSV